MLFYIKYGCSISHETLVIDAYDFEKADAYAQQAAEDIYWSYDCNYPNDEDYEDYDEDELSDVMHHDMMNDIDWVVEPFEEANEDHAEALTESGGVPFKV